MIKAFDLVPVVNKLDHFKSGQIESFCYSNTILCIGTSDGQLFRFSINKSNVGYKSILVDSKLLGANKKPINQVTAIPEIQKIIYLSDSNLVSIDFADLQPCANNQFKLKNVTAYSYAKKASASNPFGLDDSILAVCVKAKTLQLYTVNETEQSLDLHKEISLPEICLGRIQINQSHVCLSGETGYFLIDTKTAQVQRLFTYELDGAKFRPFIANYSQGEFLLNCPGNLGVFAASDAQSNRAPVSLCNDCHLFQASAPYVVCVNGETVQVVSLLDCRVKQVIGFGQASLFEYVDEEGLFIVTTPVKMYFLRMVNVEWQVEQMLEHGEVEDAVRLFECLGGGDGGEFEARLARVKVKAGMVEMCRNREMERAGELFKEANLDFRQLVKLVPDLEINTDDCVNETSEYSKYVKRFHTDCLGGFGIDSAERSAILTRTKTLIINCMLETEQPRTCDFIATLFRFCAECQPDKLANRHFFSQLPLKLCLQNIHVLEDFNRHHSVALIYQLLGMHEEALRVWKELCEGSLTDEFFPGFEFVIGELSCLKEHQLVLGYLDWAMCRDQAKAVEMFTRRPNDESERLRTDVVVERLGNYKVALVRFLEFLVFERTVMKEKYTTQLIGVYLENVIGLIKQTNETRTSEWTRDLEAARRKLQDLLQTSSNYRVQLILGRIKEFERYLQKECAILYGKIEEHEKALKILVYTLQDYQAAKDYCLRNSKDSAKTRKHLFHTLFTVYMNPTYSERDKLLKPTLDLLNNSGLVNHFDIPKLIEIIPSNWSIKLTSGFLLNVLEKSLSTRSLCSVEKSMSTSYKLTLQAITCDLKKEQLYIDEDTRCCKCHKTFESSICVRQPNGKLSHLMCRNELLKF